MKRGAAVAATALAALLLAPPPAAAQAWPSKPIRVIVPWPGGGSNDAAARPVVQKMSEALGVPFVVENRAGAAGTIGAEIVARSPGDGYTLMVHSATHVSNPSTYKTLSYRTFEDFTPIAARVARMRSTSSAMVSPPVFSLTAR